MKQTMILSLMLIAFTLTAFVGIKLHTDIFQVDTKSSSLEWYAEKKTGKHNGTILFSSGEIESDHGNFTGTFEIDMKSIEDKDLESEEYKKKLENHLKSADFFDAEKFPKAKLIVNSIAPIKDAKADGATHTVKGMLTIKDKTNEIVFDAIIKMESSKISCAGSMVIDRSKFDVKYGSKTFFPEIGDKIIYDEFTLKFNVVAVK